MTLGVILPHYPRGMCIVFFVMRRTLVALAATLVATGCQSHFHAPRAALGTVPLPLSATTEREISAELALATFDSVWTRIRNTYYDSTLKGLDWPGVRHELRPRAERATTRVELRAVLMDMLNRLGDSHMTVLPREFTTAPPNDSDSAEGPGTAGIEARIIVRSLVVWRVEENSAAANAGVRPGWVIEQIDSTRIDRAIDEVRAVRNARLRRVLFIQTTGRLQHRFDGLANTPVYAVFRDERGARRELVITRGPVAGTPVKMGHMPVMIVQASSQRIENAVAPSGCIGIVRFNYWLPHVMPKLTSAMSEFQSCAGVVLDLRGNVGGLAAMLSGVSGLFADTAATLAVQRSRGQEQHYDIFPRRANASGQKVLPFNGAIAILLDPLSVSTTEVFAAGMRHAVSGRTRVFGERSAGQALPSLVYKLPSGDLLLHAIADLRLSDGTRIEGEGVRPDVEVPLRRSDLLAGRDAAMEAALRWITDWEQARQRLVLR